MNKLFEKLLNRFANFSSFEEGGIDFWRERILLVLLVFGLLFGSLIFIPSIYFLYVRGELALALVDVIVYLLLLLVILFKGITFRMRAIFVALAMYFLGLFVYYRLGPYSGGLVWLFAFPLLSGVLLGIRAAWAALALNAVTFVILGIMVFTKSVAWLPEVEGGVIRWLVYTANILFVNALATIAATYLIQKISEYSESRVRAEAALRESEERYRLIADNTSDSIWAMGPDLRFTYLSPSTENLFGYRLREWDTLQWSAFVEPDYKDLVLSLFESLRFEPEKSSSSAQVQVRHKDGRVMWVEFTASSVRERDGELVGFVGVTRDITDRKQAELALQQSEEQYRLLVATAQDAIYIIADGKLVFVNPQVERITGRDAQELADADFSALLHPEDLEMARERYRKRLAGETVPDNYPMRVVAKDGRIRWIQASAVRLVWQGRPAILYVARDITEQRNLESQLRQAQKMEAVGTLAGGIAHDFNNILAAIVGYTELALGEAEEQKADPALLRGVLQAAMRAKALVQQILTFSRRADSQHHLIDVNQEVSATAELLRQILPKMIEIRLELSERIAPVSADPFQIQQIIMNLGTNSRDAMPDGGVITIATSQQTVDGLTCQACAQPFSGEYVVITVSDTGQGMSGELMGKIFDPFFTTKEVGKGTGLGLATVFGVVRSHNGHLNCASSPGKGTSFGIYLPPAKGDIFEAPAENAGKPIRGGRETILLVDDEPSIRGIGTRFLSGVGYAVIAAPDGEEALEIFRARQEEIALVILDLSMPGMGGHRCLRELLSLAPRLKVIVATGYSRDGDLAETMSSGAAALLSKPFDKYEMLSTVRTVLDT